ncbi:NnrS family protein [Arcobacter lacus]|uniref:Beta-carotene 15,15'-monooxygenase n=1 Tax=Arcobacter lacus TaxID=1912876 RepID=A0ABX5JJQ8_9BACT|nr:NnrS family protein [Arcobacter lacus]PUE67574.1 beta-carotene 15,15'-monooxygenase [Arcobacter lacus]
MLSWYKKFTSQPHQPFFVNGVLFFALFMMLFILIYSSILDIQAPLLVYHAYSLVFVVFIQFFLGFLFVVFPKFLMQSEIASKDYMRLFYIYFISSLGIFLSLIFYSKITIVFQVLLLIAQILSFNLLYNIHKKSVIKVKEDTKWVLIAFFVGLISHFVFLVSNLDFINSYFFSKLSINSGFYLFLFMIIFTIAQRMIPFFTTAKAPNYVINKSPKIVQTIFLLLVLKVFLLSFENAKLNLIADIPLLYVITKELIRWKLPLFKVPSIVWVLYLGLYWIVVAFFISITESVFAFVAPNFYFEKAVIHTLALGYFVTLLLGFGTRVILGHSGKVIIANKFATFIFIVMQFVVLLRIFSSISINFDSDYIFFINLTATIFVLLLAVWSSKYITILLEKEKKWNTN